MELVIHRGQSDGDFVPKPMKGGLDMGSGAADDQTHEIDDGNEQEFVCVLDLGGPFEEGIEFVGGRACSMVPRAGAPKFLYKSRGFRVAINKSMWIDSVF